jgi:hypothetical protein
MALLDELNFENVLSYAKACVDVAEHLSLMHMDGRRNIILPSRGAFPIYKTADHVREYLGHIPHDWLVFPFTSDDSQGVDSAVARRHWARVVAAESTGRVNDNWLYYQKSLDRLGLESSASPSKVGKFVMIDTAISGRAAVEITAAMDEADLDYHLLLVVDANGARLRPEYKRILDQSERITQIPVKSLYTEDRGIALMGITTALFPSMTTGDFVMSVWAKLPFKARMWFDEVEADTLATVSDFYAYVHSMHFYASKLALGRPFDDDEAAVNYFLNSLVSSIDLVSNETTLKASGVFRKWGAIETTSSLAIRITPIERV